MNSSDREVLIVDDRKREIEWLIRFLKDELDCKLKYRDNEMDTRAHLRDLTDRKSMPYSLVIVDIMIPVAKLEDLVVLDEKYLKDSRDTGVRICKYIRHQLRINEEELPLMAISARADNELSRQLGELRVPLFSRDDLGIRDHLRKIL